MLIEKIKAALLNPAEYNPRKDLRPGDKEYEKLKRSLEEFGYSDGVLIMTDGEPWTKYAAYFPNLRLS